MNGIENLFCFIILETIGYNPFKNRKNLIRWYELVRESLGPHYLDAVQEFEAKIKAQDNQKMSIQQ